MIRSIAKNILANRVLAIAGASVAASTAASAIASVMLFGTVVLTPLDAKACRDCPFPMRIAEGRWLMPNSDIEVDIVQIPGSHSRYEITLRDATTGDVLAQGESHFRHGSQSMDVQLTDVDGGTVDGSISYLDDDHERIQANFNCNGCSVGTDFNIKSIFH